MDIYGAQPTQTNGNPVFPATNWTGPLTAGNVIHSDGTGNLAAVAGQKGMANSGYAVMAQSSVINQATNGTSAGVWTDPNLIIPAQSQIIRISAMVTTPWSGASATFGVGTTASATALTAAGAASGATRGQIILSPGSNVTAISNWDNVGATDIQLMFTSTNTGNGVATVTIEYLQGINMAS
jgi:hypothetical protein